ncbi:MAG: cell division protein FtsA [Treponema sp.]|nr:cell division protein FtsA [Treponema sp.]
MSEGIIVGLDVGSSVIKVAIGSYDEKTEEVQIAGTSSIKSAGLRNGVVVNIEDAKDAIQKAIDAAEQNAGMQIDSVVTAVGGACIESINSKGSVPVNSTGKNNKEITKNDYKRVIENASTVPFPPDREKLHVIPQNFIVDGVRGIQNPINQIGTRLEAEVHIVTASKGVITNLGNCIARANYHLDGVMLKTLAATQAVCHSDELELGSILIDLGAGTTDVIVLVNGAPISTGSVPVGGNMVTSDIAQVTGIPFVDAERIKKESGCCCSELINAATDSEVILPGVGGRSPQIITKSQLSLIIQARMEQILNFVKAEVVKNTKNMVRELSGNIVLTGGGAQIEGIVELAQNVFKTSSVRIGMPEKLGGIEEDYRRPDFATAIGLVIANKKLAESRNNHKKIKNHIAKKEKETENDNWLKKFFKMFF